MSRINFFRYFPIPSLLEMPHVGVDISPSSIRFIELVRDTKNPNPNALKVSSFDEKKLGIPFSITDESHQEVESILKEWKQLHGIDHVEISIPEEKAYLFKMEVDRGSEDKIRSIIEVHLEENVPLRGEEVIFDYRIIDNASEKGLIEIIVTALPQEVIQKYLDLFHNCGLTPISFLIEAQATSKAVVETEDENSYLVVNISETKTTLSVVSRKSVQFTSTLQIGNGDFIRAIQKQSNVTPEEAEKIKRTRGLTKQQGNEEVATTLTVIASSFREEIEKVYLYWHTHLLNKELEQNSVKKIVLLGKGALLAGFGEYLVQNIKVETEIGNVWTNVCSLESYVPPISFEHALSFGAAIGLALPKST